MFEVDVKNVLEQVEDQLGFFFWIMQTAAVVGIHSYRLEIKSAPKVYIGNCMA